MLEWNIFLEQLPIMFFEEWRVAVGEVARLGKRTYRNKIQITADILELAKQGSHKTRIMYLGNLSFDLVQKYLKQLEELGLVEVKGVGKGERIYNITPRGTEFLSDFYELQKHSEIASTKRKVLEVALGTEG